MNMDSSTSVENNDKSYPVGGLFRPGKRLKLNAGRLLVLILFIAMIPVARWQGWLCRDSSSRSSGVLPVLSHWRYGGVAVRKVAKRRIFSRCGAILLLFLLFPLNPFSVVFHLMFATWPLCNNNPWAFLIPLAAALGLRIGFLTRQTGTVIHKTALIVGFVVVSFCATLTLTTPFIFILPTTILGIARTCRKI